jgi:hypothetical protein
LWCLVSDRYDEFVLYLPFSDCMSHTRDRVHPEQQLYYRGDKGFHFLTVTVMTTVYKVPVKVVIGQEHNNDKV